MNPAIMSTKPSENYNPLNGFYYELLKALLAKAGESADKYSFLAPALCYNDGRFKVREKRKAEWVRFLVDAYQSGVDPTTLPDLKGCDKLFVKTIILTDLSDDDIGFDDGIASLENDLAALVVDPAGADNSLTFTAKNPGVQGNDITIQYVDPGGTTAALAVTVNGKQIVVHLGRAASAINTTATLLKAAIDGNPAAANLVTVANTGVDTGAGLVTAMAEASLAGGTDSLTMVKTANNALPVGYVQQFILAGVLESYQLTNSTDATSSPTKIRAGDFHLTDNPRVWVQVTPA